VLIDDYFRGLIFMRSGAPTEGAAVLVPVQLDSRPLSTYPGNPERIGTQPLRFNATSCFADGRLRPKPAKIRARQEFGVSHGGREAFIPSLIDQNP
jgi:hypothetical protein